VCALAVARPLGLRKAPAFETFVDTIPRKALAGPPEEFASHSLPDPTLAALDSESAAYFVVLTQSDANAAPSWTRTIFVDSTVGFSLNVFSPLQEHLTFSLSDPNGNVVDLSKYGSQTFWPIWDSDEQSATGMSYNINNPILGAYTLSASASASLTLMNSMLRNISKQTDDLKHGYVVVYNANADRIFAHLSAYTQQKGDQVGLVARMYSAAPYPTLLRGQVPQAKQDVVQTAILEAVFPDGHLLVKPMHDDGLHSDGAANDGVFGGSFSVTEIGEYTVQATLEGTDDNGKFIRTTQHLVQVIPRMLELTSLAFGEVSDATLNVFLEVNEDANLDATYRPYFQLWGQSAAGESIPVGWFSSLENVVSVDSRNVLALQVDMQWVARASAQAPFVLRDIYVQEIDSLIPVTRLDSMDLTLSSKASAMLSSGVASLVANGYDGSISLAMVQGVAPPRNLTGTNGGKLILLHGYCADKNPFASFPGDWTDNLFYYRGSKVSMSHNEYSERVVEFAASNGLSSFGLVGHSQGGIVTLNTLNYYHTGLDAAVGNRKIQSLASPFLGNTAAGSTADLGKVFGLGCGSNADMSTDGASLWITGITSTAMSQANYYTTQYNKGGLFGEGWCNMLTNAMLNKPNDGTTEMKYAILSSGNHRSHTIGQCHIDGMKWPASYWDHSRNAEMNSQAAR